MPGPVSDSYDPEFGTAENCRSVSDSIEDVRNRLVTMRLGPDLRNILEVVHGKAGKRYTATLTERDLRVIRFAMNRALESL